RDLSHRARVIEAELLHPEGEDVAGLVAHEAVVHLLLGHDREVAVSAAVEGTRPAPVGAGALELDVLADQRDHVGGLADLLDDLVRDHFAAARSLARTRTRRPRTFTATSLPCTLSISPSIPRERMRTFDPGARL